MSFYENEKLWCPLGGRAKQEEHSLPIIYACVLGRHKRHHKRHFYANIKSPLLGDVLPYTVRLR